jgi:superfamily II DNA or RNA helicase
MTLATTLAAFVRARIRERGLEYFHGRRVRLKACDDTRAEATVRGTTDYTVLLTRVVDVIRASCTCAYFQGDEICKHIWAAILAVDASGGLRQPGGSLPRWLTPNNVEADVAEDEEGWDGQLDADGEADEEEDAEDAEDDAGEGPGGLDDDAGVEAQVTEIWRRLRHRFPQLPERPSIASRAPRHSVPAPQPPTWRELLSWSAAGSIAAVPPGSVPVGEILYRVDVPATLKSQKLTLQVQIAQRRRDGELGKPRPLRLTRKELPLVADPDDRKILSLLAGATGGASLGAWYSPYGSHPIPTPAELPGAAAAVLLPLICATGRGRLLRHPAAASDEPLVWDDGEPWELFLEVREQEGGDCTLAGSLRRGDERMDLAQPSLVLQEGLVFANGRVARLATEGLSWAVRLHAHRALRVPAAEREELLERLLAAPEIPRLDLPEGMRIEETRVPPRPRLRLRPPKKRLIHRDWPDAELSFLYDSREVLAGTSGRGLYDRGTKRLLLRDRAVERRSAARLTELGFRPSPDRPAAETGLIVAPTRAAKAVAALIAEGWSVEAEGKLYRSAGGFKMGVSSGVDWFELRGEVSFEGQVVQLPELLAALRRGDGFIPLGDGSLGVLPEEWLRRIAPIAGLGAAEGDHLRFRPAQAALLDGWLADEAEATFDAAFERARERLRSFAGVAAVREPRGFQGELRPYQRTGLGWLHYLRDFGFGGCLADDMGLGKTVQVLALLEARRTERKAEKLPPSLLVVPRSLVFNWLAEAARFAPRLAVLDHTGAGRARKGDPSKRDPFAGSDLVITTYGTLRRDVTALRQTEFDYLILDEAQAIKNFDSQTARAARLLRGRHRLALTGTPIENHLGELWSLLEFLNPGLLGASPLLRAQSAELRDPDPETRQLLARALRPFLLRRTKEAVAPELPAKVEQTLFCELPAGQRRLYDELRNHYRRSLDDRIGSQGLGKSKILVLEALLRLRQAACHPGLLDRDRIDEPSAKLDLLLPQLQEVLAEGHKALVFSQFTSFLALLRGQLERDKVPYLYLDGQTRDRQERVERFQSDASCKLFLISLKAGGLGLNLTAADYVYLLDPWWNPAVEAQAIDRTHRIGQSRTVFACRLVARNTVEEKILELQKSKRDLADAVIQADASLLAGLSREDLELLLS